jgi:DNA-binding transcriptional ArsR family regulator
LPKKAHRPAEQIRSAAVQRSKVSHALDLLLTGLTAAGLTCARRSTRLFAAIGPELRAALTAGLTAAGLTCARRSTRLFAAIGPELRAALTAGLTAAGLTCARRSTRLFAAIGPKRRAALTAGLTAAGLTYTRRGARFVDDTGPELRADLTNGLTAAEVNPALMAGNCLAYFHVTLPIKRLIARWTPPDYQSEDGRGYQPRPFQHSTAGTTPQTTVLQPLRTFGQACACCLRFRRIATNSYTACAVRPY